MPVVRPGFVVCALLAVVSSSPAFAADEDLRAEWTKRFDSVKKDLGAKNYARACKDAEWLTESMSTRITGGGEQASELVAFGMAFRASAEASLGKTEDALWHWQIAQSLNPAMRRAKLPATFGEGRAFLEANRLRTAGSMPEDTIDVAAPPPDRSWVPPAPLEVPQAIPPLGLGNLWYSDPLEVELLIDEQGRVREPVRLAGELPGRTVLELEAMRSWRFRPALVDGKPTAALLRLRLKDLFQSFSFATARDSTFQSIHQSIVEGKWIEARSRLREVAARNADSLLSSGISVLPNLQRLLALDALAAAGSGEWDDARWSWQAIGLELQPSREDLLPYGEAGAWLEANRGRCSGAAELCDLPDLLTRPAGITPPRPVQTLVPPPESSDTALGSAALPAVRFVVDEHGRVREPRFLRGRTEGATKLKLLSALREWTFEPAWQQGEPVAVLITASLHLPPSVPEATVTAWKQRLAQLEATATAADAASLRKSAEALVHEISEAAEEGGSDLLARALLVQALAETHLGRGDEAGWHWQMAQNLAVELAAHDFSADAVAAAALEPYRLAGPSPEKRKAASTASDDASTENASTESREEAVERGLDPELVPVVRQRAEIAYLDDLDDYGGELSVALGLDASGAPHRLEALPARSAGLSVRALEALRGWRFEIPTERGSSTPIEVFGKVSLAPRLKLHKIPLDSWSRAFLQQALTELEKGDPTVGACYWSSVTSLAPALRAVDPASLGEKASTLVREGIQLGESWSWKQPSEAERAPAGPRRVEGSIEPPVKLVFPIPAYPESARRYGVEGVVIIEAIIDAQGRVRNAEVLKGLPHGLDVQALANVCNWKFQPAKLNGEPVSVYYTLTVNFQLGR